MKKIMITVLVTLLVTPAWAGESSHKKLAKRLMEVNGMKQATEDAADTMINGLYDTMLIQFPVSIKQCFVGGFRNDMKEIVYKYVNVEKQLESTADKMVELFTEQEIKELIAFHESPLGQKLLKNLAILMQHGMKDGQEIVQKNIGNIQTDVQVAVRKYLNQDGT